MRGLILKQAGSTLANTTTIPKLEDGQGPILGFVDGLNLYAYLKHNPLMAFDSYGLEGEAYRDLLKWANNSHFYADFSHSGREIQWGSSLMRIPQMPAGHMLRVLVG